MVFLSPIPALIAAALTVPVLIVYYLLKLRRRPIRVSSTLLWMQAVRDVQVNVPFRWLRPSWLFFLQLAVLALLLMALARPAIESDAAASSRIVLLIDRTASMSAVDEPGGPTRLALAKREALDLLDQLSRSAAGGFFSRAGAPSVAIVAIGAEPAALSAFTSDRGRLRSIIESIEPTDQPGGSTTSRSGGDDGSPSDALQAALDLAGAMLAGDASEEGERDRGSVILLSDGVLATAGGYALAGDFRYLRIGGDAPADNLGIVAISARRDWEDPASIRVFARLVNSGSEAVTVTVALLVDDAEVQRAAVEVPAAAPIGEEPSIEMPIGEAAATFALNLRRAGVVTLRILRDDALAADNQSSLTIDEPRRSRILVVAPDTGFTTTDEGLRPSRATQWITDVIQEMRLPLRIVPGSIYERQTAEGTAPAADLVIFDRYAPARLPPVPTISFGGELTLPGIQAGDWNDAGTSFLAWQRSHPILRHISLDNIVIGRAQQITVDRAAAQEAGFRIQELARGAAGPLIVLIEDQRVPRLHIGFELNQSNWPLNYGFPIFLAGAVDHLTLRGEGDAGRAWTTAEPVTLSVPVRTARLVLEGPRRIEIEVPRPPAGSTGSRQINLGILDLAGIYRIVEGAPDDGPSAIAVNLLSESESAMRGRESIRVGGEARRAQSASAGPREIWHWFVLAALALLSIEWFLSAARMRV